METGLKEITIRVPHVGYIPTLKELQVGGIYQMLTMDGRVRKAVYRGLHIGSDGRLSYDWWDGRRSFRATANIVAIARIA